MKYIIEISDDPVRCADGTLLWKAKGFNSLVFDIHSLSKLQRYEPNRKSDEREDDVPGNGL